MQRQFFSAVILILVFSFISIQAQTDYSNGFDLKSLDKSVNPTQDFYDYAVGTWVKNNPVPDIYTRWGSFDKLQEDNNDVVKTILEECAANKNWPKGSARQKIGDFFATGMDSARIEKEGYKPILPFLKQIDKIKNKKELMDLVAEFHSEGLSPLFRFYVNIDRKKSDMNVAQLSQGGTGLPDVEYYTKDDARSKEIREKYSQHVANMFKLIGVDAMEAEKNAQTIMDIETQLAKVSNTRLENRDPIKTYNKMTLNNLKYITGDFDWDSYFNDLGIEKLNVVVVGQPKFFTEMSKIFDNVSLNDWKTYLKWNLLRSAASELSSAFVNEEFDFNGKFMNGQKAIQPRWKRIMRNVNRSMGELLGEIYVDKVFPGR